METKKITVNTLIGRDRDQVWQAYTRPEHIVNWNFATTDWHCPKVESDLRVGGTYLARMEARDGALGFDFKAVFDDIVPQEKIVYTLEDGRKVSTVFEAVDGGTQVTTVFEAEDQNPVDMQKAGWQAILNHFKAYTERHFKNE